MHPGVAQMVADRRACLRHAPFRGARRRQAGQQTAEFAFLIGTAALVAIVMLPVVRKALRTGLQAISDGVLGPDTPARQAKRDRERARQTLNARSRATSTEQGSGNFTRRTAIAESSVGRGVNTRVITQRVMLPKDTR